MKDRHITPLKAIRQKCLDCSGGRSNVRNCAAIDCPLYQFRMGKNPNRAGIGAGIECNTKKHGSTSDFNSKPIL